MVPYTTFQTFDHGPPSTFFNPPFPCPTTTRFPACLRPPRHTTGLNPGQSVTPFSLFMVHLLASCPPSNPFRFSPATLSLVNGLSLSSPRPNVFLFVASTAFHRRPAAGVAPFQSLVNVKSRKVEKSREKSREMSQFHSSLPKVHTTATY
jgi:hypothetical protein